MLSLVLGFIRQDETNSSSRKIARSSIKRNVDLSVSATLNLFLAFFFFSFMSYCNTLLVGGCPFCPSNRAYATNVPVLERTMESEFLCTRCILSVVWALHYVVELLSV